MKPALHELQKRCRTVSYTLSGSAGSGMKFDPALGFENYVRQLDDVFRRDLSGTGDVIDLRVRSSTRLDPERTAATIHVAPVAIVAGFCRHRADAGVAGNPGGVRHVG